MKTAAAYIRVSTDDQLEYSPDSQLKLIRDYAKAHDMILPDEFIFQEDDGVSGKRAQKRAEFMRMIGTAKKKPKPFDCILLWKFSRFARSRADSVLYKSLLRKQLGVEVISVSEPLGDDKMSILVESMIEAMDEYYSINLAEEVRRGMNEKVSRGEPVTAPAFGYRIEQKQYQIDPAAAPVVQMIFRDYVGGMGCRAIAEKLNAMGIRTRRGGRWENRGVEYLLQNPVYIGKIRWNPKGKTRRNFGGPDVVVTDGGHEPLIDLDTWQRAQQHRAENRALFGKEVGRTARPSFLLQGLVKCGSCGGALVRSGGGSLQCEAYAHGKCSVSHGILAGKLEEMVLSALEQNLRSRGLCLAKQAPPRQEEEGAALEKQIARERQKLLRAREAYEGGADSLEEYRAAKQKIARRIGRLEAGKAALDPSAESCAPSEIAGGTVDAIKFLRDPSGNVEQKNLLLRAMIDRIVFDRAENRVSIFYYI